jgi:hypothetical protein
MVEDGVGGWRTRLGRVGGCIYSIQEDESNEETRDARICICVISTMNLDVPLIQTQDIHPSPAQSLSQPKPKPNAIPCIPLYTYIHPSSPQLEDEMPHPIHQHARHHNHPRELQYRYFIPARRHARQPRRAAFERAAEGREGFALDEHQGQHVSLKDEGETAVWKRKG